MDETKISSAPRSETPEQAARLPPHRAIIGPALLLGVTGNVLVRSPQGPGLNVFLFFVALAVGIRAVTRTAERPPSREAWSWIIGGALLASTLVVRASPALQALAFFAASAAFAFPALRAGAAWMRGSGLSDQLEAVAGAVGYSAFGALRVIADARASDDAAPGEAEDSGSGGIVAILRGLLLAAPLLLVFGALFMSADHVFAGLVTDLVGTAGEELASHVVVTGILAWLAAGYLTGFLTGTRVRGVLKGEIRRPSIGIVEAAIVLGLVDLLFAAFVAVQFRYLFGGAGLVEVTPGLTYAEYAREGFGQLAVASALVLPTLLVSDWLLRRPNPLERTVFRALGSLQLLLLVLVIVSAFQRVRVYQEAYGLTESRFYGVAFLAWLTLLSVWFGTTVLRGRRERFAFPALLSGFVLVGALFMANPDRWIARTNLARSGDFLEATVPPAAAAETARSQHSVDAAYLASLSADAVPTLLNALPRLRPDARCPLARRLLERWGTDRDLDWRSWNLAAVRARGAVRAEAAELRRMIGEDAPCPEG